MQSPDKYRIALLAAYALALHGFENLIPMPIPWIKVGLSHMISLTTFILFGFRAAMMVTLVRVILASIFNGSFLGPGFMLSLGGGVSSILGMGMITAILPGLFGPVGLSIVGALLHNVSQLMLAYMLFVQKIEPVIIIAPALVLIGTLTGAVNGIVSDVLVRDLKKHIPAIQNTPS